MKKQNMLRSTMLLTLSGVLAKTVDFLFRAYYSRALGSEAMGIFSLSFSVHGIMLNIATGGLGVAVSKIVSECFSQGRTGDIKKTMRIALSAVFVLSLVAILVVFLFSDQIALSFLKEERCSKSLMAISPSVMFMGLSYCTKGYFYATRKVVIPASSEFLEQLIKITSITFLLPRLLPLGIEFGCAAVFLGISVGELSSCVYLLAFYLKDIKEIKSERNTKGADLASVLKVSVPIMATSLTGSFLRMQEEVLVVEGLKKSGALKSEALSIYGGVHGMAMPLIVFPLTLLSSCFTLLVPEISRAYAMKNRIRLKTLVARLYRFCTLFGFFVMSVFLAFGERLADLVYKAPEISKTLKILAVISPIMFVDSVSAGILNGMGKQTRLFLFSFIDSASRLLMIYFLVPRFGISAFLFIIIFSNALTLMLTYKSVIKFSKIGVKDSGRVWRHIVAAALTVFLAKIIVSGTGMHLGITLGILIMAAVYFAVSIALGSAKKGDFEWLFGRMFF